MEGWNLAPLNGRGMSPVIEQSMVRCYDLFGRTVYGGRFWMRPGVVSTLFPMNQVKANLVNQYHLMLLRESPPL